MMPCLLILLVIVSSLQGVHGQTGKFWHVTDFHWDSNYTQNGGDTSSMCWYTGASTYNPGTYGNYACDSPWTLVQSTLGFMQQHQGNADFVLWTGDDSAHVADSFFSLDKVVEIIGNVSDAIRGAFPNTPVIPVFGNHDAFPKHNLPPKPSDLYTRVAELWRDWLTEEGYNVFRKSGYYTRVHPTLPNVTVVGLNTPLYYQKNALVSSDDEDPAGQFAWLDGVLTTAAQNGKKAYIVAHVPPGMFGRKVTPEGYPWFRPKYNKKYLDLIIKHAGTIIGQFYGHDHTDSFKVYYSQGIPVNAHFAAPAVTPWNTTLSGIGPNNPGVRLFTYNTACGSINDYDQFFLNLPQANANNNAAWQLEYSFLRDYNLSDMSYASVDRLAQTFDTLDRTYFDRYFTYNSVSAAGPENCDSVCQRNHYCAIVKVDYDEFQACNLPEDYKGSASIGNSVPFTAILTTSLLWVAMQAF